MLKECEKIKDEMPVEKVVKEDGKDCELMKRIDIIKKERQMGKRRKERKPMRRKKHYKER